MDKAMFEREDVAEVSLECLAWADSCINTSPDDSDNNNWGTFRGALTEIIDIHPELFVPSSSGTEIFQSPEEDMIEADSSDKPEADNYSSTEEVSDIVSLLRFESDPSKNSLQDHYFPDLQPADNLTTNLGEEDGSLSSGEAEEEPKSVSCQVFKEDFKDDFMSTYIQDNVDDFSVSVNLTPLEIFKVWDLEIVGDDDVEDGLMLQLKKALDEPSTLQLQPLNDDQVVAEKSSIDDLIAGISDLSLAETFK